MQRTGEDVVKPHTHTHPLCRSSMPHRTVQKRAKDAPRSCVGIHTMQGRSGDGTSSSRSLLSHSRASDHYRSGSKPRVLGSRSWPTGGHRPNGARTAEREGGMFAVTGSNERPRQAVGHRSAGSRHRPGAKLQAEARPMLGSWGGTRESASRHLSAGRFQSSVAA